MKFNEYLLQKNQTMYDPLSGMEWELSEEGSLFLEELMKEKKKEDDFSEEEKIFLASLEKEGIILTENKNATWFLTLRCSLNCQHCYQKLLKEEKSLSLEETKRILKRLEDWGVSQLILSGGDIFLNPHFFSLLREIEQTHPDLGVFLLTNGFILVKNKEAQKEILKFKGWKPSFQVSLYSNESSIHDQITTIPGSFEKTLEAVSFLKKNGFPVLINVVLMKSNFEKRNEIIDFVEKQMGIGRDFLNFDTLLFPYTGQKDKDVLKYSLSLSQVEKLFREENFRALPLKYINYEKGCTVCKTKIAISPIGDVYPCNMVQEKMGNLLDQSIKEILKNEVSCNFLDFSNEICYNCQTKLCKKCLAFTRGNDFEKIYCDYVKLAEDEVNRRIEEALKKGFVKKEIF